MKPVHPAWILPLAATLLFSCATSSGSLLQRAKETESKEAAKETPQDKKPQPVVETPSAPKKGLKVVSDPPDADVYLGGIYKGRTPLAVEELDKGTYRISIQKPGYHPYEGWIEYLGDPLVFMTALREITGFLVVHADPPSAVIRAGDLRIPQGVTELRIGSYDVSVRRFGYDEFRTRITVREGASTELSVNLAPSRFAVQDLSLKRTRVNPDSPGLLGAAEVHFRVTAPGTGEMVVRDASSKTVARIPLAPFADWEQDALWDLAVDGGGKAADGAYTVTVSAAGETGQASEASAAIDVDRSLVIAARSLWSGASGLLFSPSAETLPPGIFQASMLLAANVDPASASLRAPGQLSFRVGLAEEWELGAGVGLILGSQTLPVTASLSVRHALLAAGSRSGFAAAIDARASWQHLAATDPFTDFTGAAVGFPMRFTVGPLSILAAPQLVVSPWSISYDPPVSWAVGLHSWAYLRGGILLDLGGLSAGVSAAVRSSDFLTEGFSIALPFQAGAEAHWVIPGTHFFLSGMLMAEIESLDSWYGLAGGGWGLLY